VQRELESYPVRLEVLLNGGDPAGGFRVVNLGVPGANTALVRAEVERALAAGGFDLVVALAGYNDEWNVQEPAARGGARLLLPQLLRWIAFCLRGERTSDGGLEQDERGFYVRHGDGSRQYVNTDPGSRAGRFTGRELEERVAAGLRALVAACRERGVPLLLQTYASRRNDRFESASAAARAVAQEAGVPLVDQAAWFDAQLRGSDPATLFQPDGHPTGPGYDQMARALHARIAELAAGGAGACAGWKVAPIGSEASGAGTRAPAAGGTAGLAFEPVASDSAATLRFRVRGPVGGTWRLAFARAAAASGGALGLALDDLFQRSRGADGLAGRFDASGTDEAWVARSLFAAADGTAPARVQAQLLLVDPYATSTAALLLGASAVAEVALPAR
jgi:lysophospholipase L1-like esterase